jgi:hypothetical protein
MAIEGCRVPESSEHCLTLTSDAGTWLLKGCRVPESSERCLRLTSDAGTWLQHLRCIWLTYSAAVRTRQQWCAQSAVVAGEDDGLHYICITYACRCIGPLLNVHAQDNEKIHLRSDKLQKALGEPSRHSPRLQQPITALPTSTTDDHCTVHIRSSQSQHSPHL